jgi:hypothetical protein
LSAVSLGDVRFPFGFFLVEEGGKLHVVPATQDDRRKTLLKANPDIRPEAFSESCFPNPYDTECHGGCGKLPPIYRCMRFYDESTGHYGCACMDIS